MPSFMSIGKEEDTWVDPGEIKGDTTGMYHKDWMRISSFQVDIKDERRTTIWNKQDGKALQADDTQEEKPRRNVLRVTKPFDSASLQILEWAKTSSLQDIQIDCCAMEEDWPFLSLLFLGVTPIRNDLDDTPSDSLEFSWKRAMVFTWAFDEKNEPSAIDFAEFGEEEASGTSTTEERGIATYVPPPPDPNEGAGRAPAAAQGMALALAGGGLPAIDAEKQIYDQERRTLAIDDVGSLAFDLESLRGDERLSSLYQYDLELRSDELSVAPADVVGHEVSFRIEDDEGREEEQRDPRYVSGIVSRFLAGEMASDRHRRYHATVVPSVWKLTQRSDSRVFQDKTVKEVVQEVFSAADFSDYDDQGVTRSHPPMTYCVQYQESDFAFVSRLLEEFGIWYTFKHEEGRHTMMLCDGPTGYVTCPEDPLRFAHDVHREPRVTAWRQQYAFVPGKFDSRDYNFTTPREPVKGQSTTQIDLPGIQDAEIFEYPGQYEDAEQATSVADLRLQERETGHHFVHAVSCYDSLVPGMTIAVENLPGEDPEGDSSSQRYLITGVRHHAEQLPEYGMSIIGYRNVLTCIPEEVNYTPPRVTPKPRIFGPQTAVVVGDKETDEDLVDTDEYGRVKVQFHWDRHEHEKDTDSSCWIRVAQSAAGGSYGAMVIPRIGWEVVVSFIDGNPDRPLVTGVGLQRAPDAATTSSPGAKHKTTLMTHSWPERGQGQLQRALLPRREGQPRRSTSTPRRTSSTWSSTTTCSRWGRRTPAVRRSPIEGDCSRLTINQGNCERTVVAGQRHGHGQGRPDRSRSSRATSRSRSAPATRPSRSAPG